MAEHLLKFIRGEIKELDDPTHIKYKVFKQNPEYDYYVIDFEDMSDWVRKMNPNVKFDIEYFESTIIEFNLKPTVNKYKAICYNKGHMSVIYNNGSTLEIYETAVWQHTANNCSLYAGLVLILRPLVNNMNEMFEILKQLEDIEGSKTCEKLAAISKYYFGRGLDMFRFRFGKKPPELLPVKHEYNKTLYIHFHGLNPYGALYCESNTRYFKQLKGRDFRLYMRSICEPRKELYYFINWFNIMKHHYSKFVLMGHSYGSVFSNYFAQYLIDNDKELNDKNVISVSLDGSELIDTMEWFAYTQLNIDRKHKIEYLEHTAICNGIDIVEEFNKQDKERFEKEFGADLIECDGIIWYRSAKANHDLKLNHRHICFGFSPNPSNPDEVKVVHDKPDHYEIYHLKEYEHALFMFEPVAKKIMDIIDESIN